MTKVFLLLRHRTTTTTTNEREKFRVRLESFRKLSSIFVLENQNFQLINENERCQQLEEKIEHLKRSIDQLTQLIVRPTTSNSWFEKIRRFWPFFQSKTSINDECCRILNDNHLTKNQLIDIYQLFDRNETIFRQWLRTFLPEHFVSLLFNYVEHFPSTSSSQN